MRRIVTGVDGAGLSCVVELTTLDGAPRQCLYSLAPGELPPRPVGHGVVRDVHVPLGHVQWDVYHWPPDSAFPGVHQTDTTDLHTVVRGSITLILGDGDHLLEPGDCAVVAGVDHAWRAGADGCVESVVIVGMERAPTAGLAEGAA